MSKSKLTNKPVSLRRAFLRSILRGSAATAAEALRILAVAVKSVELAVGVAIAIVGGAETALMVLRHKLVDASDSLYMG